MTHENTLGTTVAKALGQEHRERVQREYDAAQTYYSQLAKGINPRPTKKHTMAAVTPEDVTTLLDAAKTMGKTQSDVLADERVVAEANALLERIHKSAGCDGAIQHIEALKRKLSARRDAIFKQLDEQWRKLDAIGTEAHSLRASLVRNKDALTALKANNPELLATVEIPDSAAIETADLCTSAVVPSLAKWLDAYHDLLPAGIPDSHRPCITHAGTMATPEFQSIPANSGPAEPPQS